jgi:deoxyribonuclease-2
MFAWLAATDERALLLQNKITPATTPYANFIIFNSGAGMTFKSIAKNMYWDTPGDNDFYNDLVGPALMESIEVETWEDTKDIPGRLQIDKVHTVLAMQAVDLSPLDNTPSYEWSETCDHAKLAISDKDEKIHFVCVGDINFTISQEKRSGGTVAFIYDDLWASIFPILKDTVSRTSTNQKKKTERKQKQ